jgi:hypothetical protein
MLHVLSIDLKLDKLQSVLLRQWWLKKIRLPVCVAIHYVADNSMSSIQCEVRSCKLLAVIEWLQINDPIFPSLFSNHAPQIHITWELLPYHIWGDCRVVMRMIRLLRHKSVLSSHVKCEKHIIVHANLVAFLCRQTQEIHVVWMKQGADKIIHTLDSRSSILISTWLSRTGIRDTSSSKRIASATKPRSKCKRSSLKSRLYVMYFLKLYTHRHNGVHTRN